MSSFAANDVTVVVPAFNAEHTVVRTLESLCAQSAGRPRVVVVDDGSTDDTAAVAAAAGAEVVRRRNGGPGAARNTGVAEVRSMLLAFCDADDVWPVDRLTDDLEHLRLHPTTGLLLGRTHFDADDDALLDGMHFDRDDRSALIPHFGASIMRAEVMTQVGPIAEDMHNYEDYDWFLRARERGVQFVSHDRVSLHRRMHRGSTSQTRPGDTADLLATLQRSLRRRRVEGVGTLPTLHDLREGSTS